MESAQGRRKRRRSEKKKKKKQARSEEERRGVYGQSRAIAFGLLDHPTAPSAGCLRVVGDFVVEGRVRRGGGGGGGIGKECSRREIGRYLHDRGKRGRAREGLSGSRDGSPFSSSSS